MISILVDRQKVPEEGSLADKQVVEVTKADPDEF
jgi:hypothetical protein